MKQLYAFEGQGKCARSVAYVLGETEFEARARLLRDDACEFFDIKGTGAPLRVLLPGTGDR